MKSGVVLAYILVMGLAACQAPEAPLDTLLEPQAEAEADPHVSKRREFVLHAAVVPLNDTEANFGIDLKKLTAREAAVVESAWFNYQRVLAGKKPECSSSYGLSDGGSVMYECDSYDLMRVKSLAGTSERPGFEYGPMLDFLNGNKIERVRFFSYEELELLEAAP